MQREKTRPACGRFVCVLDVGTRERAVWCFRRIAVYEKERDTAEEIIVVLVVSDRLINWSSFGCFEIIDNCVRLISPQKIIFRLTLVWKSNDSIVNG